MSSSSKAASQQRNVQWCSDQLHDLMGFADSALAMYLVHVASSAKSMDDIQRVLVEGNVKASPVQQSAFCNQLFQKCRPPPRLSKQQGSNNNNNNKVIPATNADWVKKASTYALLEEEEEDLAVEKSVAVPSKIKKEKIRAMEKEKTQENKDDDEKRKSSKSSRLREKKKRSRRKYDNSSDSSSSTSSSEEEKITRRRRGNIQERRDERQKRVKEEKETKTVLSEKERAELDRDKDLRERDEFVKRLLERDQHKTKDKIKQEEHDESEEAYRKRMDTEQRLAQGEQIIGEDGNVLTLEKLRTESRRAYLKKRQEREVTLLKQSLQDEEELFRNQNLTAAERKRIALSKKILSMVEENEGDADENANKEDGFYRLPDEYISQDTKGNQDKALLSARYVEPKHEKSEQELWEESQTRKAAGVAGGHKKTKTREKDEKEYELVFDDQIDFVMQETSKGYDRRDDKKKQLAASDEQLATIKKEIHEEGEEGSLHDEHEIIRPITEHEKILVGRKKLPVFPYREEFLAAVKDHQILVLVGETGSGKVSGIFCKAFSSSSIFFLFLLFVDMIFSNFLFVLCCHRCYRTLFSQ
jgi:pre-mRNA-splicing factor ATP-dependent RNA helicase DHX16